MEYFFTYSDDLPSGCGFELFGLTHVIWLIAVCVLVFIVLFLYDNLNEACREMTLKTAGAFLFFLIVIRIVVIVLLNRMSVYELPLHLCSIAGILCFIHSGHHYGYIGQILYTLCLPGTISALLYPNWDEYPPVSFISVQSFLFHGGIVLYVLLAMKGGIIVPAFSGIIYSVIFLLVITPPVYMLDRILNVNYLFVLRPSGGSPLEWLAEWMGVPGYLIGYAVLVIGVMLIMNTGYQAYIRIFKGICGKGGTAE